MVCFDKWSINIVLVIAKVINYPAESKEELTKVIQEIISQTGAASMKDMGKVMGMASEKLAGKADGKTISGIVKNCLLHRGTRSIVCSKIIRKWWHHHRAVLFLFVGRMSACCEDTERVVTGDRRTESNIKPSFFETAFPIVKRNEGLILLLAP